AEEDLHLLPEQAQFRTDLRVLLDWLCGRRRQSRVRRWARRAAGATLFGAVWVAEALLFTLVMQLGFALITAIYFHRITWSGIVANLLVLPLAGLLPPLGLVTVGIAAVS